MGVNAPPCAVLPIFAQLSPNFRQTFVGEIMPVREILLLGNPELWRPSSPVTDVHSRETRELISDLAATLDNFREQNGFGRGIAAPQIGVQRRMIFLN